MQEPTYPIDAVESLKTLPFSREAEQSVLGGLMLSNEKWIAIAEIVTKEDFHLREHQILFNAIQSLSEENNPCDPVTLSEWLQKHDQLDAIGGGAYLGMLVGNTPSAANITAYAEIVRDRSVLRQLVQVGTQITESAFSTQGRKTADLLDEAERLVFEIAEKGKRSQSGFVKIDDILDQALERIDKLSQQGGVITGISTGFDDLDKLTSGLQQSDLIIVAGRPSMGKCVASDCKIVLADGHLATIEEIYQRKKAQLFALGQDYQFYLTQATDFIYDGIKPVFRVTTDLGRCVETTLTHPFLTSQGWHPLSKISVGEKIAVPRKIGVFGVERLRECQIKLLAYVIGGDNSHPQVQKDFSEAVEQFAAVNATIWLEKLGLDKGKFIPAIIFRLELTQIALFLNRLFATRAWIDNNKIVYCGENEELIRQVQHLLLRFGIIATYCDGCQLEILDANSIHIFVEKIGIFTKKPVLVELQRAITREKNEHDIDIYWDKIKAIEAVGLKPVYDLTIPETHNFVANDVCVHNTSFAMNLAEHAAINNKMPVAVFSMEMSNEQLAMRLISSLGRVNLQNVRTGNLKDNDWTQMTEAVSKLTQSYLFIDETPALNPTELRSRARRLAREKGQLGLVVIDYLQLMQVPNNKENRTNEVSEISRALKSLAKELNVPVVALSQLNRSLEQRSNKRPIMSDLRESGEIEQSADLVIFIYRDEVYNENSPEAGKAEIIVAKQRNGPIGTIFLTFKGEFTRFESNIEEYYHGE